VPCFVGYVKRGGQVEALTTMLENIRRLGYGGNVTRTVAKNNESMSAGYEWYPKCRCFLESEKEVTKHLHWLLPLAFLRRIVVYSERSVCLWSGSELSNKKSSEQ